MSKIDYTKNYARTGEIIDANYLQKHPDQLKTNFLGALNADPNLMAQMNPIAQQDQQNRMQNAFGHIGAFMQAPPQTQQQPVNQNYPQAPS